MSVLKNIEFGYGPDSPELERWYEQLLVKATLKKLFRNGFKVGVQELWEDSDEEKNNYSPATEFSEKLLEDIFNYDEVHLDVIDGASFKRRQIFFVFGNGADCLTDYSASLENLIKSVYETVKLKLINLDV